MSVDFSTLSHHVHRRLNDVTPLKLGQAQQLLAASLGYASLAAYKVSKETIIGPGYFVLDLEMIERRQHDLGYASNSQSSSIVQAMMEAIRDQFKLVGLQLAFDGEDLFDLVRSQVEGEIASSEEFANAQAITNTAGLPEFQLEFEPRSTLKEDQVEWVVQVEGSCGLEQDQDRPYCGDELDISAELFFQKIGRRLLRPPTVNEITADVQGDYPDQDFPDSDTLAIEPIFSEAEFNEKIDAAEAMAQQLARHEEAQLTAGQARARKRL